MQGMNDWLERVRPWAGGGMVLLVALGELINRVWVAAVFWRSGVNKLQTWDSTLYLFEYEYQVPLLPFELAAYLGTAVELAFPVLLALGLAGRFSAGVLLVFNLVAVISYPTLNAVGVQAHQIWGVMLLVALLRGPGLLSADVLLGVVARRLGLVPRRPVGAQARAELLAPQSR